MPSTTTPAEAVLDTNAVLDWLLFQDAGAALLGQALVGGALRWVATAPMLDELHEVLRRPQFAPWHHRVEHVLTSSERLCQRVDALALPIGHRLWCSDPDDQGFIDLAVGRAVPWLLTRDKALLRLARRAQPLGVRILRPAEWPGP